jgi:uncharacterized repeat protein (TIGR02543 family)
MKFKPLFLISIIFGVLFFVTAGCTNIFMEELLKPKVEAVTPGDSPLVTWTVTFECNDGSYVAGQTVVDGEKATRPDNPEKDGYGFVNWYSDEALTVEYDFNSPVTRNITLYAKWSNTVYTVTFESNGGSAVAGQNVGEGGSAVRPPDPTKDGFAFDNWYSDKALTIEYDFNTPVTGNITLYAKWIRLFTVTFNSMGGSHIPSQSVKEGEKAIRPDNPTRSAYGFMNWYSDEALTIEYNFNSPVTGNITLYAKWNENTYTVTFVSNGGSSVDEKTVGENGTVSKPSPDPTKDGYVFDNWYSDETLTVEYDFNSPVTRNITLYAKWIQIFTVTFNANANGDSVANMPDSIPGVRNNTTINKPSPDPSRTGYTFAGWYKEPAGNTAWNFITDPVTSNTELYAKWTPNAAVITITVVQIEDQKFDNITGGTISRSGEKGPKTITFKLDDPDLYTEYEWSINGVGSYAGTAITGNGSTFTIFADDIQYNSLGKHAVYLTVWKGGVPYNKTILVTIEE